MWLGCLWIKSSNEEETRKKNSLSKENIIRYKLGKKKKQVLALKELGTSITVDKVSAERKREEKWFGQSPSGI